MGNDNFADGWVKSYRSTRKKGWYKKSEYFHLWHHLLYKANHEGLELMFSGQNIQLKPGQFITGRKVLAKETGINESKVERILNFFEKNEQQIEQQKSNRNRVISILNWSKYQQSEQQIEQQVNNKRTTGEQQVNTNKNEKNNKNDKDDKNYKEIDERFQGVEFLSALKEFYQMRNKIKKPMTDRAKDRLLNRLSKIKDDPVAVLNQSCDKDWQDVYPVKNEKNGTIKERAEKLRIDVFGQK